MRRRPLAIRPRARSAPADATPVAAPGFAALDLNILKEFKLHGNTRLQARWEIFNVTNRVNLGTFLSTSTRSGVFGQDRLDAGRRSRQSGDRLGRTARDAVGAQGAVLK